MRYVDGLGGARTVANLQKARQKVSDSQSQASSGLKHARASDDTTWYDTHTKTQASLARNENFQQGLSTAQGRLERSDGVLEQATSIVTRLQELSMQMANSTYTAADRAVAASEVRSLKEGMITLANEKDEDGYLFGGFKTDTPPYDASGNFVGDTNDQTVAAGIGLTVKASIVGTAAFDFAIFDTVANAMDANDPLAVKSALGGVQSSLDNVTHARSMVGDRLNVVQQRTDRLQAEDDATQAERARVVEADPIEVYTNIARHTSALEAALKVSAKSSQMSLFDLL
jgi:flagellar hook-associated protein 3 FlgL